MIEVGGQIMWLCLSIGMVWWIMGVVAFVCCEEVNYAFEYKHVFVCLFVGILGPFAFAVDWTIHGELTRRKFFKKKRKKIGWKIIH